MPSAPRLRRLIKIRACDDSKYGRLNHFWGFGRRLSSRPGIISAKFSSMWIRRIGNGYFQRRIARPPMRAFPENRSLVNCAWRLFAIRRVGGGTDSGHGPYYSGHRKPAYIITDFHG